MAKVTVIFGVLLLAVSVGFWLAMGRAETAALHPAGVGLVLLVCGLLANTENARQRMLWMHIAVTVGLIGFLITGVRAVLELVKGTALSGNVAAFEERAVVAVLCLLFVAMCVRSFIAARRGRALASA